LLQEEENWGVHMSHTHPSGNLSPFTIKGRVGGHRGSSVLEIVDHQKEIRAICPGQK
jgi:hypothetical protein